MKGRKHILVYDCEKYSIHEIDCGQYQVFIKRTCLRKTHSGIDRYCYCGMENGINYVHEMAKETIEEYFTT